MSINLLLIFSSMHGIYIKRPILQTYNYNVVLFSSVLNSESYY